MHGWHLHVLSRSRSPHATEATDRVAKAWAWEGNPGMDHLDLWLAPDAKNPTWQCLTTLNPTVGRSIMLTYDTVLPATTAMQMAIRGIFRYSDPSTPDICMQNSCIGNGYDDQDDLVFAVATPVNLAPVVEAGANQTVKKPRNGSWTATLAGTATDDGLPKPPGALTYAWTKTSGGSVTFGTPKAATTTIKGSSTGTYVFKLTVSDGAVSAADTVTVTVTN
jgi:hypothetical protein